MDHKSIRYVGLMLIVCGWLSLPGVFARAAVIIEVDKTYLVDRTGERWDISQAVSIGFDPGLFEFGIGRHAFRTLNDGHWQRESENAAERMRVIGVSGNGDAHAYSVGKLRYHETANTLLGDQPIVAGY